MRKMGSDEIALIHIDSEGRLCVSPKTKEFPFIYREAMEVSWDKKGKYLYSPKPRKWSYREWYTQIIRAAQEQGCELVVKEETKWVNISEALKDEILSHQASA